MVRDARRAWAGTLVGRTLAERYRLDELIDVGGMGAVFVGRHLEVDRAVAVKTVVPGALDEARAERLRREARQAAAVGGRGVVDVIDFGVDEVCGPFLVMELLVGETLEARLDRGPRPTLDEACAIAIEILDTLARVHARGIVHRDLKPQNLFLARVDDVVVVKILDFGIARSAEAMGGTLTTTGAVVGTPRYMAPEQARGDRRVDARADVYAMGAILYRMLSGRSPYDDLEAYEALAAAAAGPPRPLRQLAPRVPEKLAAVVDRAMAFDREARFSNAAKMGRALREARGEPLAEIEEADTLTSGGGIRSGSESASRSVRWPRIVGWVVAVALLVGVGLYVFDAAWSPRSTPAAGSPPEVSASGAVGEEAPDEPMVGTEREAPVVSPAPEDAPVVGEEAPELEAGPPRRGSVAPGAARGRARGSTRPGPDEPAPDGEGDAESPGRTGSLSMEDF